MTRTRISALAVVLVFLSAITCPSDAAEPSISASLTHNSTSNCEYHAPPGTAITENLTVANVGIGTLTGTISVDPASPWLTVSGTGPYTIAAGSPSFVSPLTMSTVGLAEGLYQSTVVVTHNDPTQPNPLVLPVDLFVFTQFQCSRSATLHTKWLWLQASSTTRLAHQNRLLGLYRSPSSGSPDQGNSSIYDASLIIAKPPAPDTIVYRDIFGLGLGQPGYRAITPLSLSTSAYGTNKGSVRAWADLTTMDAALGIHVEYRFPQNPDSGEFVLINYDITNETNADIAGLTFGEAADLDVIPSTSWAWLQRDADNTARFDTRYNLIYQQGADSVPTHLAAKYLGGMSAIQCTASPRAWDAPNDPWLSRRNGRGFHEGYLYQELAKSGFEILPDSNGSIGPADRHAVLTFEKDVTLAPAQERRYCLALVSSANGPDSTDLLNATKKAWRFAFGWHWTDLPFGVRHCSTTTVRYTAVGSHEAGLGSGCFGCVVSKLSGSDLISLIPDANPCTGSVFFSGSPRGGPYSATLRLQTPACAGQPQYTEDRVITFDVWFEECFCSDLYEMNYDYSIDVFDVLLVISRAFGGAEPVYEGFCPNEQGDGDNNGVVDVFDVIRIIQYVFNNGPWCVDPCEAFWNCQPR